MLPFILHAPASFFLIYDVNHLNYLANRRLSLEGIKMIYYLHSTILTNAEVVEVCNHE